MESRRLLDGAVTGVVWNDWNQDGQQRQRDAEYQVANVEVNLLTPDGDLVDTTTTNRDGIYDFSGVESGPYLVEFVAPQQTEFTNPRQAPVYYEDSDADPLTGRTHTFQVEDGATVDSIDAGIFSRHGTQTIRGTAWNDTSVDGIRQEIEPTLAGVEVQLENSDRNKLLEVDTDAQGNFVFPGERLLPGEYFIEFKRPKDGQDWEFTQQFAFDGSQPNYDSDVSNGSGRSVIIGLDEHGSDQPRGEIEIDAGFFIGAEVQGTIWNDVNRDGLRSDSEHGVPAIDVQLYSPDGGLSEQPPLTNLVSIALPWKPGPTNFRYLSRRGPPLRNRFSQKRITQATLRQQPVEVP